MTRLLVSVRDAAEAGCSRRRRRFDRREGAARRFAGSGVASSDCRGCAGCRGSSAGDAALGELTKRITLATERGSLQIAPEVQFAKVGLAGCAAIPDWQEKWQRFLGELPPATAAVAVIYADWPVAAAPAPSEVLDRGAAG